METLLNAYGGAAFLPVWVCALPLLVAGMWLRRSGRRRAEEMARLEGARRELVQLGPGAATVNGMWRALPACMLRDAFSASDSFNIGIPTGLIEDDRGRAALVVRDADASSLVGGEPVLVVGLATHTAADPRARDYRAIPEVWILDARGDGMVTPELDALTRSARSARRRTTVGAVLVSVGLAALVASALVVHHAAVTADDAWDNYESASL